MLLQVAMKNYKSSASPTHAARLNQHAPYKSINVDNHAHLMRYFSCEVGLAMCHSTGSIGDTLIGPFYLTFLTDFIYTPTTQPDYICRYRRAFLLLFTALQYTSSLWFAQFLRQDPTYTLEWHHRIWYFI